MFVGYHARAGTTGAVLDHTYTYRVFRVRVDDMIDAGEFALNTALAGCFAVPVVFVSGDEAAVAEARELLPGVTGVAVKTGRARTSARLLSCDHTRTLLRDGAQQALRALSPPAARPAVEGAVLHIARHLLGAGRGALLGRAVSAGRVYAQRLRRRRRRLSRRRARRCPHDPP